MTIFSTVTTRLKALLSIVRKAKALVVPLWTTEDVAEKLGVSTDTLERWRRAGDGPKFIKFGRNVRYDPEDVQAFINSHKASSTSSGG